MAETILVFGDSNTHGTPPMALRAHHPRIARRWPVVMADHYDCTLIEEGLPGRTACALIATTPDLHLDGQLGLRIALNSHGPIDRLIIMLGTNDLKTAYGNTPHQIVAGLAGLLAIASDTLVQEKHGGFSMMLIAPPPIKETGTFVPEFFGGAATARALTPLIADLARQWGADFLDAGGHIDVDPLDGTHFNAAAHDTLGKAVAASLGQRHL